MLLELQDREQRRIRGVRRVDPQGLSDGTSRLVECFIPPRARDLYRSLKQLDLTLRLGDTADVGIGYVTGANGFYHLTDDAARHWGIPDAFLRPAVRRGRSLAGLRFTREDWHNALRSGEAAFLLLIEAEESVLPDSVLRYLHHGRSIGVPKAFKCRTRSPWYRVPHVYEADAFLTYMSGSCPRLVSNDARVVAPNSLHLVRIHPLTSFTSHAIAALWQTSLTRLSVEIEGHALGGGLLKLEPTEAENLLIPASRSGNGALMALARELDNLIRQGNDRAARALADRVLLVDGLGLSVSDCRILRNAAEQLCQRRYHRKATPNAH